MFTSSSAAGLAGAAGTYGDSEAYAKYFGLLSQHFGMWRDVSPENDGNSKLE